MVLVAFGMCLVGMALSPVASLAVGSPVTVHYPVNYGQTEARGMRAMVNAFRADPNQTWYYADDSMGTKVQLGPQEPLKYDANLEVMAMQRAAEIGLLFSHMRPSGLSSYTALPAGEFTLMGENIAIGYGSAESVMEGWKETNKPRSGQGHRINMLRPGYNAIGIGHCAVGYFHCWVQELGGTSSPNEHAPAAVDGVRTVTTQISGNASLTCEGLSSSPTAYTLTKAGRSATLPSVSASTLRMRLDGDETFSSGFAPVPTFDVSWSSRNSDIAKVEGNKVLAVAPHGSTDLVAQIADKTLVVPVDVSLFTDVNSKTSHANDIYWLADSGITTGFSDGTFRPYDSVVRCDMAAFLFRVARQWGLVSDAWQPTPTQMLAFRDVTKTTPHAREVWWLASTGISKGWTETDGSKTFRPSLPVARQDMAAFLFRLAQLKGRGGATDEWSPVSSDKTRFRDVSESTAHAREVWWLASTEVSTGWRETDGTWTFRGLTEAKRADMAAFLHRLSDLPANGISS